MQYRDYMQLRYTENRLRSSKCPTGILKQGNGSTIPNFKLSRFEERFQMSLQMKSTLQVPIRINNCKAIPRLIVVKLQNMKNKKKMFTASREKRQIIYKETIFRMIVEHFISNRWQKTIELYLQLDEKNY